jgi:hypothetical protein
MRRIILAFAFAGILGVPAFGQGVDPLIGTWKLNLEKSTSTGPLPKSMIVTYSAAEGGLIGINDVVGDANSQAFKVTFRHVYDGMPHPTTGSPDFDQTAYTRIGNTINVVRFRQGKAVEVAQIVIVPGKSTTNNAEGIAANDQPYHSVLVFDRQ